MELIYIYRDCGALAVRKDGFDERYPDDYSLDCTKCDNWEEVGNDRPSVFIVLEKNVWYALDVGDWFSFLIVKGNYAILLDRNDCSGVYALDNLCIKEPIVNCFRGEEFNVEFFLREADKHLNHEEQAMMHFLMAVMATADEDRVVECLINKGYLQPIGPEDTDLLFQER